MKTSLIHQATIFSAVCLLALSLAGCGSGSQSEPAPVQPLPKPGAAIQPPSVPAPTNGASVVTAPVDYLAATMQAGQQAKGTLDLAVIRKAIDSFQEAEGALPGALQDLVGKSYLPALPSPPVGKQFQYDPRTGTVDLIPKP